MRPSRNDAPRARATAAHPSAFWPTVWLAVALVAVKATYVGLAIFWDWAGPRDYLSWLYIRWVAAAAQADLLFALGLGVTAAAMLFLVRGNQRVASVIARSVVALGILCIWYAVIGRQFFASSGAPLTYQLLALGGDPRKLASSLAPFVTAPVIVAMIGAPVAYLLLVRASQRFAQQRTNRSRRAGKIFGALGMVVWLGLGRQFLGTSWFEAQDRYVAESPDWVLAQSFALNALGARSSLRSVDVRREDVCELLQKPVAGTVRDSATMRGSATASRPQNVILIVLESVGAQFLNVYGSQLATTPRLSQEQGQSLVFDSYYAPVGWTAFSLYSIVLSKRPPIKGYNTSAFTLDGPQGKTLANVLSDRGYRTAFMSAGDPDWASKGFFEGKGFAQILHGLELTRAKALTSWGVEDRFLFDGMREWIQEQGQQPFFLMAWTDQTHHPYKLAPDQAALTLALPGLAGTDQSFQRYLTLVHEADAQIGKLLDFLRARGLAENTLVVITGDHGEAFGRLHHVAGHGFTVYDEEVRVPLIIWNPKLPGVGQRSRTVGTHVDLSATLLDILGIAAPTEWDGRSLLARDRPVPAYLFAAGWGENLLGVRDGDWKYVFDARRGRDELYNVVEDPTEQKNVSKRNPERAGRLRQRLAAWLRVDRGTPQQLTAACR